MQLYSQIVAPRLPYNPGKILASPSPPEQDAHKQIDLSYRPSPPEQNCSIRAQLSLPTVALVQNKATVGEEAVLVRCNLQRQWHLAHEVVAGQVQHTGVQVVEAQRCPAGELDPEEQEDCFGHFRCCEQSETLG